MESEKRELDRRELIKMGAGALGVAAGALVIGCGGSAGLSTNGVTTTGTTTGTTTSTTSTTSTTGTTGGTTGAGDPAYLNFLLNLEYIKAQYYSIGSTGKSLSSPTTGTSPGTITGGSQVTFATPDLNGLAVNLAQDEVLHISYLQSLLGSSAISMPNINFTAGFLALGNAAGLGASFNAFASEENFFLGSFFFEDMAVTAQFGVLQNLTTTANIDAVAGIIGTDSYHAGAVRYALFSYSNASDALLKAGQISAYRGSVGGGADTPPDQSISLPTVAPHDTNGLVYARTTREVENIVYLGTSATTGGFFPNGLNGTIVSTLRRRR